MRDIFRFLVIAAAFFWALASCSTAVALVVGHDAHGVGGMD